MVKLKQLAYARSGDKGDDANIGVIAYHDEDYRYLQQNLTEQKVATFFHKLGVKQVVRYEMPKIGALNFVLIGILQGGGSRSLRSDAQGKALGQAILEMDI